MHSGEYIKLINEASSQLKINVTHFSQNWAIKLSKFSITKFIIGYTFPSNDSTCYKIARNKNLCSEILTLNKIPNIPHQLVFSPSILVKRKVTKGNYEIVQKFISENGFPFLIKKNNSSGGDGVFLITNEPELENILSAIYNTDSTLCLCPYRENIQEYRNVVLDGECLLSYEKLRPFISGDGRKTIIELLSESKKEESHIVSKAGNLIDDSLIKRFTEIPKQSEKVFLQWKHNATQGTRYEITNIVEMKKMAIEAAQAIHANFASVDIAYSDKFGFEVLEINASVVLHLFSSTSLDNYRIAVEIYRLALKSLFDE